MLLSSRTIIRYWASVAGLTTIIAGAGVLINILFQRYQFLNLSIAQAQMIVPAKTELPVRILGNRLGGQSASIDFPSSVPTLALFIDRNSPACENNWSWWRRIETAFRFAARLEVVDIRDTFSVGDARHAGIEPDEVLLIAPGLIRRVNRLKTPTMILFSRSGETLRIWSGVFNNLRYTDLQEVLTGTH